MTTNYSTQINTGDDEEVFGGEQANNGVIPGSGLDILQEALREKVRQDDYSHAVPLRKTLRIILDPNIDGEALQRWTRSSIIGKRRGAESETDTIKLSSVCIANCMVGVEVKRPDGNYVEAFDTQGNPLTFRNQEFRKMLVGDNAVTSNVQLVRKLFGNDGHLMDCAKTLMETAGYGDYEDDLGGEDPLG